jgi:hypothetical protein
MGTAMFSLQSVLIIIVSVIIIIEGSSLAFKLRTTPGTETRGSVNYSNLSYIFQFILVYFNLYTHYYSHPHSQSRCPRLKKAYGSSPPLPPPGSSELKTQKRDPRCRLVIGRVWEVSSGAMTRPTGDLPIEPINSVNYQFSSQSNRSVNRASTWFI